MMREGSDPVLEAIAALRSRGHTIEPLEPYPPSWLVDGDTLTEREVVALALERGLMDRFRQLQ